jgi:hypothetical protein
MNQNVIFLQESQMTVKNHSWDAQTYNTKVSTNVQLEWARNMLEKRRWIGNGIVTDAGAGSGNLTKILCIDEPQ